MVEQIANSLPSESAKLEEEFRKRYGCFIGYPGLVNETRMFAKAVNDAKSEDPKAVAAKLEGMTIKTFSGGDGYMRKDDHQFFQDMYIANFGPFPADAKFDEEKTGWGWKTWAW